MLRRVGPAPAEDVVQEALWRTHRALRREDRALELRPWLYKLVHNGCLDVLGRAGEVVDVAAAGLTADPRGEPGRAGERKSELRRLVAGPPGAPPPQRHAAAPPGAARASPQGR